MILKLAYIANHVYEDIQRFTWYVYKEVLHFYDNALLRPMCTGCIRDVNWLLQLPDMYYYAKKC